MSSVELPESIICVVCGRSRSMPLARSGQPRIPSGWKVLRGQSYCSSCKFTRYILRAVTLPVVGPVDGTWAELREVLRDGWSATTMCANWMITELYARDARPQPGDEKLATMPRMYLYPEARRQWPTLPPRTIAALERRITATYRRQRLGLLWTRTISLATFRHPMPLPLPRLSWKLEHVAQRWHLVARIGERWWTLRLRGGPHTRRQAAILAQVAAEQMEAGEGAIYLVRAHPGDHRTGLSTRQTQTRVMVKIVVWLPRGEPSRNERSWHLRTSSDAFLAGGPDKKRCDWTLQADHVRRWLAAETRQRAALIAALGSKSDSENRHADGIKKRLARLSERSRHRLATWAQEAASHAVDAARRQSAATLEYDDHEREYVRSFPWTRLRSEIQRRCEQRGIVFMLTKDARADDREAS